MSLHGRIWKYGSNVNTDVIIPGRYCHLTDPKEVAKHCFEDLDPAFLKGVRPGDIVVAENNFGCGSSRELAPVSMRAAGVSCVVANTFARIFYRNAINIGLPILECPPAVQAAQAGDEFEIDLERGTIRNVTRGLSFQAHPFPPFVREIIEAGGLMARIKRRLEEQACQVGPTALPLSAGMESGPK